MKSTLTTSSITRFAFDNFSPLRNGTKSSIRRRRFKPFATVPGRQLGVKPSPGWRRGRGEEEQKLKEH
jgi:hypothetical protein